LAKVPGRLSIVASSGELVPGVAPTPAVPGYLVGDLIGHGTLSKTGLRPVTNSYIYIIVLIKYSLLARSH
jgi:hypothetical protein